MLFRSDGLEINLDKVPKKYEGLDGTELAISESQERMAVVVSKENVDKFIELAEKENLLYSNLDLQPKNIQILAEETKMELPQLIEVLLQLQLKGLVKEPIKNYYCLSGEHIIFDS